MTAATQLTTDEILAEIDSDLAKVNDQEEHQQQLDILNGIAQGKKMATSRPFPSWLSFAVVATIASTFGLMAGFALF